MRTSHIAPLGTALLACALAAPAMAAEAAAATTPPQPTPPLTLERLVADPPLAGRLPRDATLAPGGQWVAFLKPSAADSEVLELWAQAAAGGAPQRVVAQSDLIGAGEAKLTEAERMALERKRIAQRGITGYGWCGKDGGRLIVPLSGDLYAVVMPPDWPASAAKVQRLTHDADAPEMAPACSPDGQQVAFVKSGNLWVQPLQGSAATHAARALTTVNGDTHSVGLAEFIASEELDRDEGFWWSPSGAQVLAIEVDESTVPLVTRAVIAADGTRLTTQRYPAAGAANARLTPWVFDVNSGQRQRLALPEGAEYIARAGWFDDGTPWLITLTRDQRRMQLLEYAAAPGDERQARVVIDEQADTWVDVHDDLRELPWLMRSGLPALLWGSERSGVRQLELVDRRSGQRTPVTQQAEPVLDVVCASAQRLVFSAAADRGRASVLLQRSWGEAAAPAARTAEPRGAVPASVQAVPGGMARSWRSAKANAACTRLLVNESALDTPPRLALLDLASGASVSLAGDAPDPALARWLPRAQALTLTAADGRTALNALAYTPPGRKHFPVLMMAYGGPGAANATWQWARRTLDAAWWLQRGYGVLVLDTRGSPYRERAFSHAHHHAFGQVEVNDLFAAARQVPQAMPGADARRLAFFGWSYGGFLAARAMLDAHSPFAAAVAVAAPTDWTLYDTAYTERYLGLPRTPTGEPSPLYERARLTNRASLLQGELLLMHGTADDNVLFDNALQLIDALQKEGKRFDLAIYPGKAHGIAGRTAQLHLYRTMDAFLARTLHPGGAATVPGLGPKTGVRRLTGSALRDPADAARLSPAQR